MIAPPELLFLALVLLALAFLLAAWVIQIKRIVWRTVCRWFSECLDGAAADVR